MLPGPYTRVQRRSLLVAISAGLVLSLVGCSAKLETGYEPRKIGSNEAERRGFYAAPFSPEARKAEQESDFNSDSRRPKPGY